MKLIIMTRPSMTGQIIKLEAENKNDCKVLSKLTMSKDAEIIAGSTGKFNNLPNDIYISLK